jgi:signal peptidase I
VDFMKRVVGVPGDRIHVQGGKLWRNGQAVAEAYIKEPMLYEWPENAAKGAQITVPEGNLVVLGDNRNDSNDSHRWELVASDGRTKPMPFLPKSLVRGVLVFRFWPPGRIGPLE